MGDKNGYLEQLKFANKKTIEIIDSIQERSSENIIIIISDHGYRYYINYENPTVDDYIKGFNNLATYYLPGEENRFFVIMLNQRSNHRDAVLGHLLNHHQKLGF